jgi:hypothetical protein
VNGWIDAKERAAEQRGIDDSSIPLAVMLALVS